MIYLNQNITFKNENKKKIIQIEPSVIDEAFIMPLIEMRHDESMKPNKDYELDQNDKEYFNHNIEALTKAFPDKGYYLNLYKYAFKEAGDKFYVRWNRRRIN